MNKVNKDNLKITSKNECPYCGSKNIRKDGIKGGLVAKKSSKLIPHYERYKCISCNKYFHKKLN